MGVLTTLPLFVFCSVSLSDRLSQKPKPPQLDLAKPGLGWAARLLYVLQDGPWSQGEMRLTPAPCNEWKHFSTEATLEVCCFLFVCFNNSLKKKQLISVL